MEVVGADQDKVGQEVADGVAQDPTRSAALEGGIQDLEVTATVNLQMVGIAQALEAVLMAVGSLVGVILFPTKHSFYKFTIFKLLCWITFYSWIYKYVCCLYIIH